MDELSSRLAELGLDRFAQVFSASEADLGTRPLLSEGELEALGLLLGHCKKLLNALAPRSVEIETRWPRFGAALTCSTASRTLRAWLGRW